MKREKKRKKDYEMRREYKRVVANGSGNTLSNFCFMPSSLALEIARKKEGKSERKGLDG